MPARILLPRFDTHGDLILLEGFLEALLALYPSSTITLLVRPGYDQLASVFPSRLRWHTIALRPYQPLEENDGQVDRIRGYFATHQYDLVIGTCFSQTWADAAVGALANPGAYRIALCGAAGPRALPPAIGHLGDAATERPLWDRTIAVDEDSNEGSKYQTLIDALASANGAAAGPDRADLSSSTIAHPKLRISRALAAQAAAILQGAALSPGAFVLCCPVGVANIGIKRWSSERFAEVIAWLEQTHHLPTLLVGHTSERQGLETVCTLAQARGAWPRIWIGRDGQLTHLAALASYARLYVGNDTGPMHLAAAANVPTVAVFGGGHWPRFVPPANTIALTRELLCFRCNWNCLFGDALCVKLVRFADVVQAIETLLDEIPASAPQGVDQALVRTSRPSSAVCVDTSMDVEPVEEWLAKAERVAQFRTPSPLMGLIAAVTRRLRGRRP